MSKGRVSEESDIHFAFESCHAPYEYQLKRVYIYMTFVYEFER
jgi:hypothetical protein